MHAYKGAFETFWFKSQNFRHKTKANESRNQTFLHCNILVSTVGTCFALSVSYTQIYFFVEIDVNNVTFTNFIVRKANFSFELKSFCTWYDVF